MAGGLVWRTLPILTLTIRQFLGGKAVRVVTVLAFIPAVFAAIYLLNTDIETPRGFLIDLFLQALVAPTLLPIMVLILATAALGNEVEDRTLPYLTLKPVARLRIVLEKLFGVLVVALPAVLAGLAVTALIAAQGQDDYERAARRAGDGLALAPVAWAMLGAAAVGTVLIAAVFLAISLVIPRALLAGIVYVFAWESVLGRFLPGIRIVSIRHYIQSVFVALLDDPDVTIANATSLRGSLLTVAVVCVVAVLFATWRLRSMNLE
jgi:ABC-2 type transport system permease protein